MNEKSQLLETQMSVNADEIGFKQKLLTQIRERKKQVIVASLIAAAAILGISIYGILKLVRSKKDEDNKLLNFLLGAAYSVTDANNNDEKVPTSFFVQPNYWEYVCSLNDCSPDSPNALELLTERILATVGTNLYDAATWQIALSLEGLADLAAHQTKLLASDKTADGNPYSTLRAVSDPTKTPLETFTYGEHQEYITDPKKAYLFRMIGPAFWNKDPLAGWGDIPDTSGQNWVDWKPITGENAWALLIGPLQMIYLANNQNLNSIDINSIEIQMARQALTAFQAMQSTIGAIYYTTTDVAPNQGPGQVNPYSVSLENNFSTLAGLNILKTILEAHKDSQYSDGTSVSQDIATLDNMIEGILNFVVNYAYDQEHGYFYQGGQANNPELTEPWVPVTDPFAVDVQTWGATVLGQQFIDDNFGEGAAFRLWEVVKEKAAYYKDNDTSKVLGVGYTEEAEHNIISAEWTFGAINMVKALSEQYSVAGKKEYAKKLATDAKTMEKGVDSLKSSQFSSEVVPATALTKLPDNQEALLYANFRYNIPFGWIANPIPSTTSTAWALMMQRNYNPFVLGGSRKAIAWQRQTLNLKRDEDEAPTSSAGSIHSGNFLRNVVTTAGSVTSMGIDFLRRNLLENPESLQHDNPTPKSERLVYVEKAPSSQIESHLQISNLPHSNGLVFTEPCKPSFDSAITMLGFFAARLSKNSSEGSSKTLMHPVKNESSLISKKQTLREELNHLQTRLNGYLQNPYLQNLSSSQKEVLEATIVRLEDCIDDVKNFSFGKTTREDIADVASGKSGIKSNLKKLSHWLKQCELQSWQRIPAGLDGYDPETESLIQQLKI